MNDTLEYLDLTTGTVRAGQYWSDAPLVTGRHAVWVVMDGKPVHVHRPAKRHRDTQRALAGRTDVPEYVTGVPVRAAWSDAVIARHDLTREV
jgi:hypothetical protein